MAACLFFVVVLAVGVSAEYDTDYTVKQLPNYKDNHEAANQTTSSGKPVTEDDLNLINEDFYTNDFFMDTLTHISDQVIPERVVHAKGTAAFGYFEVTQDVTAFCKANLFSEIGKKTPMAVRFSKAAGSRGVTDIGTSGYGMALKFYTEEGNWDLVGVNTPVFSVKDPALGLGFLTLQKNPVTGVDDPNISLDFFTQRLECWNVFLRLSSESIIPDGYRHMTAWPVHTFQIENNKSEIFFARFTYVPDAGVKSLNSTEANNLKLTNPDYFVKDLYNAIYRGDYPSWTLYWQLLTQEQVNNATFDVFDPTKLLPEALYPLREIGRIVLNRNPINQFEEVEQLAMFPGNLVPGITGSPDRIWKTRTLMYRNTQKHRLGVNFNNIPVNRPINTPWTYNRFGAAPTSPVEKDAPHYFPNSFNGPKPSSSKSRSLIKIVQDGRANNLDQANDYYLSLSSDERAILAENIASSAGGAELFIQERVIEITAKINSELSNAIASNLGLNTTTTV